MSRLEDFIFKQKCIPTSIKEKTNAIRLKYNTLCPVETIFESKSKKDCKITFIIPHFECAEFIIMAISSIESKVSVPYTILIADDFSDVNEFQKLLTLISRKNISLYRFTKKQEHSSSLEWLYHRAKTEYVVIMDQDAQLLSNSFSIFEQMFRDCPHLLIAGTRDKCMNRNSPLMIHPSFAILNKKRINKRLKTPLFLGGKYVQSKFQIHVAEPYHTLSQKSLHYHKDSIYYLEVHQTKYGFGSVTYFERPYIPIAYHQWYSGRTNLKKDDEIMDGLKISDIKKGICEFKNDYKFGKLDLSRVEKECSDINKIT